MELKHAPARVFEAQDREEPNDAEPLVDNPPATVTESRTDKEESDPNEPRPVTDKSRPNDTVLLTDRELPNKVDPVVETQPSSRFNPVPPTDIVCPIAASPRPMISESVDNPLTAESRPPRVKLFRTLTELPSSTESTTDRDAPKKVPEVTDVPPDTSVSPPTLKEFSNSVNPITDMTPETAILSAIDKLLPRARASVTDGVETQPKLPIPAAETPLPTRAERSTEKVVPRFTDWAIVTVEPKDPEPMAENELPTNNLEAVERKPPNTPFPVAEIQEP